MMFKIGDKVKITINNQGQKWYSDKIFTIIGWFDNQVVILDKKLNQNYDNTIHVFFLRKLTKKEQNIERKNKLQKLNEL
jgi:hypothetical protein